MPSAVGFPEKKVFEDELRFAGRKGSSAGWARYPGIDTVRQSLGPYHFIQRVAVRTGEVDLCGLDDEGTVPAAGDGHRY
jgi:hypothetical protein